jgi:hypothetical protein
MEGIWLGTLHVGEKWETPTGVNAEEEEVEELN